MFGQQSAGAPVVTMPKYDEKKHVWQLPRWAHAAYYLGISSDFGLGFFFGGESANSFKLIIECFSKAAWSAELFLGLTVSSSISFACDAVSMVFALYNIASAWHLPRTWAGKLSAKAAAAEAVDRQLGIVSGQTLSWGQYLKRKAMLGSAFVFCSGAWVFGAVAPWAGIESKFGNSMLAQSFSVATSLGQLTLYAGRNMHYVYFIPEMLLNMWSQEHKWAGLKDFRNTLNQFGKSGFSAYCARSLAYATLRAFRVFRAWYVLGTLRKWDPEVRFNMALTGAVAMGCMHLMTVAIKDAKSSYAEALSAKQSREAHEQTDASAEKRKDTPSPDLMGGMPGQSEQPAIERKPLPAHLRGLPVPQALPAPRYEMPAMPPVAKPVTPMSTPPLGAIRPIARRPSGTPPSQPHTPAHTPTQSNAPFELPVLSGPVVLPKTEENSRPFVSNGSEPLTKSGRAFYASMKYVGIYASFMIAMPSLVLGSFVDEPSGFHPAAKAGLVCASTALAWVAYHVAHQEAANLDMLHAGINYCKTGLTYAYSIVPFCRFLTGKRSVAQEVSAPARRDSPWQAPTAEPHVPPFDLDAV